ncbi:MAG: Glu/Leu/Phe/Val dehydrogenase dimerization domain-containing protein [Solirubrobacteraceae bacterium]
MSHESSVIDLVVRATATSSPAKRSLARSGAQKGACTAPEFEAVRVARGKRSGATIAIAVHRTVEDRSLGGCRMWHYDEPGDAVADAERLARSMSLKAAAAGLSLGGAKAVIALPEGDPPTGVARERLLRDFAELIESFQGRYITGQDVGVSEYDISRLGHFTRHVAGRPVAEGGAGDPSPYTARGVEAGIRASFEGSLRGRHAVVLGLGHVGGALARRLHAAGARLTLSDVDQRKRALADELGASWVTPGEALTVAADVLAPCALGGVFDHETVRSLEVPVIAGAANTQLVDDDVAEALAARGITWAPDFIINAGGLIAVASELGGFERERALRAVDAIADTLSEVYARARSNRVSTLAAAKSLAHERLSRTSPLAA